MTINLNDWVKVKLTDHGKDIYYHQYDELNEKSVQLHGRNVIEPSMPKVDADGYTTFQLWCLIELYGPHMHMGRPLPFDVNIVIEQKKAGE